MNDNEIDIQAGEWLARMDRGDMAPELLEDFNRWKQADARHKAAFVRLAATWQALDRVRVLQPKVDATIRPAHLRWRLTPDRRKAAGLAVAATLLVATALWASRSTPRADYYETTRGGFQRIVLQDHSAIELNTDTRLRVKLGRTIRKIELLRGEANFEVFHDATRPFVVLVGQTGVMAVGTRFDVLRRDDTVEVTVDEGRVMIGAPEALQRARSLAPNLSPLIIAGQTAVAGSDGVKLKTLPKDAVARKLAWQDQMLAFDGDSLSEVVAQFNRYNDKQLAIADSSVATLKVGGYFKPTNLDNFVKVLESNFGVRATPDGNRILLALAQPK